MSWLAGIMGGAAGTTAAQALVGQRNARLNQQINGAQIGQIWVDEADQAPALNTWTYTPGGNQTTASVYAPVMTEELIRQYAREEIEKRQNESFHQFCEINYPKKEGV